MIDKLKPCPFCGGEAEMGESRNRIWCDECELIMPYEGEFETRKELAQAWNRRSDD